MRDATNFKRELESIKKQDSLEGTLLFVQAE
jgi:hypothetical protein